MFGLETATKYDFNYKILGFLIIINGVFVVCMLSELSEVVFNSNSVVSGSDSMLIRFVFIDCILES